MELFNTTRNPVDIGYCMIDDIDGGSAPHQIPASTIIPAHGFWTLDRNGYFNNTGDSVRFLKEDAATLLWIPLPMETQGPIWRGCASPMADPGSVHPNVGDHKRHIEYGPPTHYLCRCTCHPSLLFRYRDPVRQRPDSRLQHLPLKFCPDQIMNRGESAVFMLRANFGSSFAPGPSTHVFKDDWTKGTWAEPWADAMYTNGLSAGCSTSPLKYCPWDQIPREQAVIFALRMKYGTNYIPPAATGTLFADMTNPSYYATSWAEQAYKDGLIPNCGTSGGKPKFCPKVLVSRGLGAYMIVRAKNLTMP